ncbi:hypothetical protein UlMin_024376 [Ulmus minor]
MANPPTNVPKTDQTSSNLSISVPSSEANTEDQIPIRPTPHEDPSPRPVQSPRGTSGSVRPHPVYRGIRSRSGKWVSEIREPRKTTRIWLGTYPTPEMAAAAYDAAALALKGPDTALNFPESLLSYPAPASNSASDIRAAAAKAAESRQPKPPEISAEGNQEVKAEEPVKEPKAEAGESSRPSEEGGLVSGEEKFFDEEAVLNMPNLLVDMAEGMLVSPPRINSPPPDNSSGNSDGEYDLWS